MVWGLPEVDGCFRGEVDLERAASLSARRRGREGFFRLENQLAPKIRIAERVAGPGLPPIQPQLLAARIKVPALLELRVIDRARFDKHKAHLFRHLQ